MTLRSLGLHSDFVSMKGFSTLEAYPLGIVMRTPSEPHYWSGNVLIKQDHVVDPAADIAFFKEQFPQCAHVKILWDTPCPSLDVLAGVFPDGYAVDSYDVLTLDRPVPRITPPQGIVLRVLGPDADWAASEALAAEIAAEEGYDPAVHAPFLRRRYNVRRAQVADDLGAWFGAFEGDQLVAHMGMFHDDTVARYQAVETRATHRRRGICAALLSHVSAWAASRAPDAVQVIVAEADSDAGRLYRRQGFAPTETLVEVTHRGY